MPEKDTKNQTGGRTHTPYDDAFRILIGRGGSLVIPFINELFKPEIPVNMDAQVKPGANELFLNPGEGDYQKSIMDSLVDIEGEIYHMECQSTDDGEILVRIVEYDFVTGWRSSRYSDGVLRVPFPHSGLLFLRKTGRTPERLHVIIETDGTDAEYDVRVQNLADYALSDLIEKNLLFLMPFYMFNHENALGRFSENDEAKKEVTESVTGVLDDMRERYETGEISYTLYSLLTDMFEQVTDHLTPDDAVEEVDRIMRDRIVYRGDKLIDQGREEGLETGRKEGRMTTIVGSIQLLRKMGLSDSDITEHITDQFKLNEDEARDLMERAEKAS